MNKIPGNQEELFAFKKCCANLNVCAFGSGYRGNKNIRKGYALQGFGDKAFIDKNIVKEAAVRPDPGAFPAEGRNSQNKFPVLPV